MIIDLILDRQGGIPYDAKEFYNDVIEYENVFDFKPTISRAMDIGTEKDVKKALCDYVISQGYNKNICKYINSVNWVDDFSEEDIIDTEILLKKEIEKTLFDKKIQDKVSEIFPKEFTDKLVSDLQLEIQKAFDDYMKLM